MDRDLLLKKVKQTVHEIEPNADIKFQTLLVYQMSTVSCKGKSIYGNLIHR